MVKEITLIGTLPPIKGISDTCFNQVKYLTKHVSVDFIGFRSIYPEFLYPGSTKENDKSFRIESFSGLNIRNILTWYNPFSWVWAGITTKGKIVHFHWWTFYLFPVFFTIILLCKLRGKIIICEVHNILGHESGWVDEFLTKLMFKSPNCFIVHSENNKKQLEEFFGIKKDVSVIPLGTLDFFNDVSITKTEARKKLGLSNEDKIILSFGNIRRYKGIDVLIEAFVQIKKEVSEAKLLIAGKNWIDWQPFQRLIEKYNLKNSIVTNLDFVPTSKVKYYFMASDLVVLAYLKFEAQSGPGRIVLVFGKAIVVSNTGGLPDLVKNKEVIVKPGDPEELAQSIIKILKDDNFRRELEKDSKELAQKYSWDKIARTTMKLYIKIIQHEM